MAKQKYYGLAKHAEMLIAENCIRLLGPWQVTLEELAKLLGEDGRVEKIWRVINKLAEDGKIQIIRTGGKTANAYKYIGREYQVLPGYERVISLMQTIEKAHATLLVLINELKDRDKRKFIALKNMKLIGQTEVGYLYSSVMSIEEQCHDMDLETK